MLSGYRPARALSSAAGSPRSVAKIWGVRLTADLVEELEQADRQRIGLLARRTPRDPHANGQAGLALGGDRREHLPLQILEHLRVAEEARDVDQHVPKEGFGLGAIALHDLRVLGRRADAPQQHAPGRPTLEGRIPVLTEVHARGLAERGQHARKLIGVADDGIVLADGDGEIGLVGQGREPRGNLTRRQHQVHDAAGDGSPRHPGVLRRLIVLRECDAAGGLDLAQAERAVGAGARQHDANGIRALHRGE